MADFESSFDYLNFAHYVRCKSRHVMDEHNGRFVDAIRRTSKKRRRPLPKDTVLWRAQLAHRNEANEIKDEHGNVVDLVEIPAPAEQARMKPLPDRAYEGRVNPKGIPCLYFSDDRDTAMAEVRPWIGSYVSVAQFVMLRDLSLVDCSVGIEKPKSLIKMSPDGEWGIQHGGDDVEAEVWWELNKAFSAPVTRSDDVADYSPTQVIAEVFKLDGCDGVAYGSSLGKGRTFAVFDLSAAELANCHLYEVKGVTFSFDQAWNPYYVSKYADGNSTESQSAGTA